MWCRLQSWQRGLWICSRWCTGRRAVGREHSPEELQCWSYVCWMRIFPASLAAACLSGSWWSTDSWRWGRRAVSVYSEGCPGWWMNEWMIHLYSTLLLYTQSTLQSCEGGGGGGLSSTTTSVQHPLGWFDGCHRTMAPVRSPHTSYRWRGERVIEPIKWMGIIRRPWLIRASGGNLARTPGLHPYSLREVQWDF